LLLAVVVRAVLAQAAVVVRADIYILRTRLLQKTKQLMSRLVRVALVC
jgi:hypothetical protein